MSHYCASSIVVFVGPSLSGLTLPAGCERLPPAAAGDLLRLLSTVPCTVVLIDGVFDARPAPWHKEILVLLARGFRVIGAASMGALRAAELDSFGMIGVGGIYRAYADGRLTGDDEVALLHAPPELGAQPLSLAQVDVRATLYAARRAGVIGGDAARCLRAVSAAIHYRERSWDTVLAAARTARLAVDRFAAWLPDAMVDAKRRDALAGIALARRLAPVPPEPRPEPPRTIFLERLADAAGTRL